MKHLLKNYILTFDNLIKFFLKTHNINIDEYTKDINNLNFDQLYRQRFIKGIDTYPYIYILYKMKDINRKDLEYFLQYFQIMLSKINGDKIILLNGMKVEETLEKVLEMYLNEEYILYLIVMIQYYFL